MMKSNQDEDILNEVFKDNLENPKKDFWYYFFCLCCCYC